VFLFTQKELVEMEVNLTKKFVIQFLKLSLSVCYIEINVIFAKRPSLTGKEGKILPYLGKMFGDIDTQSQSYQTFFSLAENFSFFFCEARLFQNLCIFLML